MRAEFAPRQGALASGAARLIGFHVLLLVHTPGTARAEANARLLRRQQGQLTAWDEAMLDSGTRSGIGSRRALKSQFPYYHSTSELRSEVERLATGCNGALSFRSLHDSNVSIDVVDVRANRSGSTSGARNRVFILFGEHSRELIGPESGLQLLRALCGEMDDIKPTKVSSVLEDSEFQIVLNGNPRSRQEVESGDFCKRTNPAGVDLNRNWDEKWAPEAAGFPNANPGPRPFSEPETRIFKKLVMDYGPHTFLTVHSGTRGLYMPWAYDTAHLANRNQPQMLEILRGVDSAHCKCPFGAAGREVGYACPGTCLDWVFDHLKTPYAFAFEIYTSPSADAALKERWEEKVHSGGAALLEGGHGLAHPHFSDVFQAHPSDFVQIQGQSAADATRGMTDMACFSVFNPNTRELYEETVRNWATAYLDLSQLVAVELRKKETQAALMSRAQ